MLPPTLNQPVQSPYIQYFSASPDQTSNPLTMTWAETVLNGSNARTIVPDSVWSPPESINLTVQLPRQAGTIPAWVIPVVSLVASALVAIAGFFVQRWRYRVDRLAALIEQLCSEINSAADLATDYWLLDCSKSDEQAKAKIVEPRLIGRQLRIQVLINTLNFQDGRLDLTAVENLISAYYDALSGRSFATDGRATDIRSARDVQMVAGELNGLLRDALSTRIVRLV